MDALNLRRNVVLGGALAGGVIGTALLWRTTVGASYLVAVLLFVATGLALARRPSPLGWAWAAAASWSAGTLVWYQSQWTLEIALPTSLLLCATLPLVLHKRLGLASLGDLPALAAAQAVAVPGSLGPTGRLLARTGGSHRRRVLGGLLLGFPIALVAGSMLRANPQFDLAVERLLLRGTDVVSFLWWSVLAAGILAVGAVSMGRLHRGVLERLRSGSVLGSVPITRSVESRESPYRADAASSVIVERVPRTLTPVTWAVVLGQLVAVFGLFVLVNLPVLFGGHGLVRAPDTVTYAAHLHSGFYAVTTATLLATAVVMFGHRAVAVGRDPRLVTTLEVALLGLTTVTLASCWQRLSIYMDAYGVTHLRLGVVAIQLVVLGLLVATLVRSLLRSWQGHMAAVVLIPIVVSLGASSFDADLHIARVNLARMQDAPETATSTGLDAAYLRHLSVDAIPALDAPHVPAQLAAELRDAWELDHARTSRADWRGARGLGHMIR